MRRKVQFEGASNKPTAVVTNVRERKTVRLSPELNNELSNELDNNQNELKLNTRGKRIKGGVTAPLRGLTPFTYPPAGVDNKNGEELNMNLDMNLDQLLDKANKLSSADRSKLLAQLAINEKSVKLNGNRDFEMWILGVETALNDALGGGGAGAYGVVLIKQLLGSSSAWAPVERFMTANNLMSLPVVQRQAVYLMLARLLVKAANHVDAPLTPKLLGNMTPQLPGIFDQAFPGYMAAGFVPFAAAAMGTAHERMGRDR